MEIFCPIYIVDVWFQIYIARFLSHSHRLVDHILVALICFVLNSFAGTQWTIKASYSRYLQRLGGVINLCDLFVLDLNHSNQRNTLLSTRGEIFQLINLATLLGIDVFSCSDLPQSATLVRIRAPFSSTLFSHIYFMICIIWVWNFQICSDLSHFSLLCSVTTFNSTVFALI